jgi:putative membrane protein
MYVRRGVSFWHLFHDSWRFLVPIILWSVLIVYLHEIQGYTFIAIPMAPVTIVGIAVTLYLGFKSTSAYNRWWEARKLWGQIITDSRSWAFHVINLVYAADKELDPAVRRELIDRHLAWVNALAHWLRSSSRLKESRMTRIFNHRRVLLEADRRQHLDRCRHYLSEEEAQAIADFSSTTTQILRRQSDRLRDLARNGFLDSYRHVKMMSLIDSLLSSQGGCERIKNTPFPRQIANFGQAFTLAFILFLPLGLVEIFEAKIQIHGMATLLSHEYMFTMVPFAVLISWIFFIMEKVSDTVEDPFEGGITDVPISAICRTIEIELSEMVGADDLPEPLKPVDGVLY